MACKKNKKQGNWFSSSRRAVKYGSDRAKRQLAHALIGASAAKPYMDDTSAIFHIYIWGERSEAPHGRYIWDFPYIIYHYRRTSDRSNFAWRRTARRLTAHAHRCVKLKQGQSILNKVRKGMQAKSKR